MEPLDALWHLLNFAAPAAGLGFFASALAKLFWYARLKRTPWWRLWAAASGSAAVAMIAGLVLSGHDGRLTTYAAMVAAAALGLWWFGLRASGR